MVFGFDVIGHEVAEIYNAVVDEAIDDDYIILIEKVEKVLHIGIVRQVVAVGNVLIVSSFVYYLFDEKVVHAFVVENCYHNGRLGFTSVVQNLVWST